MDRHTRPPSRPRRPPARRPRTPKAASGRERTRRVRLLTGVAVLLLALLGARAAFLGTVRADDLSSRGREAHRHQVDLLAPRGSLVAADGTELASDRLAVDVTASPDLVTDDQGVAARLAPILKRDPNDLANKLAQPGRYAVLARDVPPRAADRARDLGIAGIYFSDTYQRFVAAGPMAAQVIGLTGDERQGLSGMEKQLDENLTGTPGQRLEVRDVFGRPIQTLSDREAVPGQDVQLTLVPAIQAQVESTLAETREATGAKSAMAIVMDPRDGSILAMASVPRFNPNHRAELNQELERNRPVVDTFEPGSTFKIATMTAALEDGKVTPWTRFVVPDHISDYDGEVTLKDSHEHATETMTATQILEQSSNVGVYKIALRVGKDRLLAWYKRFGFGAPTGIDFPGEASGFVLPGDKWYGSGITNVPIGQGVSVTLTQLTRAYAAIANGGLLVKPHLVKGAGGVERRIMHASTAAKVDRMLRKVVSEQGTGELADVKGYEVAGKTGTAEKIDPTTGRYSDTAFTSSFVGYAPADDPQLLIAVVVDEPTGIYYGGDVAAPAFEKIAEFSLQNLRILP
jgi:cell division protein FtsI/penicillin-binding protein 2